MKFYLFVVFLNSTISIHTKILNWFSFQCEGIGVPLALRIMGKVGVYCLAEDIVLIPEIVLLDLNPCEAARATLL